MSKTTTTTISGLKVTLNELGLTQAEEYEATNEKFLYAFECLSEHFVSIDEAGAEQWIELVERKLERLLKEGY